MTQQTSVVDWLDVIVKQSAITIDPGISAAAGRLSAARYYSVQRILLDGILWTAGAGAALFLARWWITLPIILLIGALPLHDLLVHGHEGTHDLISRSAPVNEFFTWLTLGLVGISATAHRAFHLDHHLDPHTDRDPEFRLFNSVVRGVPGWAYLLIPAAAQIGIDSYPFRSSKHRQLRRRVAFDLLFAVLLHAVLAVTLGIRLYLMFVIAPMYSGLFFASVLRGICEHHSLKAGSKWTNARTISTNRSLEFFWSNVNYHLEHHLFPSVPFHKLPELQRLLKDDLSRQSSVIDYGYVRTSIALLKEPAHFKS